ncbi:LPS assembly lipoprotein LptE [Novosphingobium sp. Leaf2]|uniref:LPS assembly lipoprotein LptE n=1 Tax=Novosphingobium sp. Leaf2 TaxID=1735670 RepID=UPI0006FDA6D1|nr:LPS assembly lipoprotein LptE [Novosphingobium sp. Leaf2]KQM21997.1 hypothetical protein ASE49_01420 [Novosphingobium sp. Leaf2]
MKGLAVLLGALALAGCGLKPMYAGGGNAAVAQGLAGVQVSAIQGKAGWLVRNALVDELGMSGAKGVTPRYRLDIRLDDKLESFALLSDDTVGRERRTLRARYQLVDIGSGAVVLDETAGTDAGIDVVSSDYATIAAEQTALENMAKDLASRITTNIALRLRGNTRQ